MYSAALTPVESPVSVAEMKAYIGVDGDDLLLSTMLASATTSVINFVEHEIVSRQRKVIYERWPTLGTNTNPSVSRNNIELVQYVKLPFANLDSSGSIVVTASNEVVAASDYRIVKGKPDTLFFEVLPTYGSEDHPDLTVEYFAGFGTAFDVPEVYKMAIIQIVSFLYEHRGACSADSAMIISGASSILTPLKYSVVVL